MTKIEKLLKEYVDMQKAKASHEEEVAKLQREKEALEQEAELAAENGDLALYKEKKADINDLADRITVTARQSKKLPGLADKKALREAWAEYAAEHDKAFEKAWSAYIKQRQDLFNAFQKLTTAQNEALKLRERLCRAYAGETEEADQLLVSLTLKTIPDSHGVPFGNPNLRTPDTDFYLSAGLATFNLAKINYNGKTDLGFWNDVIRMKKAVF